jgi:RecB family exonuclease
MVRKTVYEALSRGDTLCVFPTETAAQSWANDYVRNASAGVIRLDQVMAWDRFRALFLPVRKERPVNNTIRYLFALRFLEQESTYLQWFRYADFPEHNRTLAPALVRLLTMLDQLHDLANDRPEAYQRIPEHYRNDAARVSIAYRQFLSDHDLYEPQFLQVDPVKVTLPPFIKRVLICFPEVCSGFEEFAAMKPFPSWIDTCKVSEGGASDAELCWFPNELMELRSQLYEIVRLLDTGVHPEEITITIGDSTHWQPYVEHEAALLGLTLSVIEGKSPLQYSPGAFLHRLTDLITHEFSLDTMKAFLLDPQFPFVNRTLVRQVIMQATAVSVLRGSIESVSDDQYLTSLNGEESIWYQKFRQQLLALNRSHTSDTMRRSLLALSEFLFGPSVWVGQQYEDADAHEVLNNQIWLYCLDQIDELASDLDAIGVDSWPRLFSLYVQLLSRQTYIPHGQIRGISVYPYRISAGLSSRYHFIFGCTEAVIEQQSSRFPLLSESIYRDDTNEDDSAALLALYRVSAEQVRFSAAKQAFGGTNNLAPSWFIDHHRITTGTYHPAGNLYEEQVAWSSGDLHTWQPMQFQREWFDQAMRTAFIPPRVDFAEKHRQLPLWDRVSDENNILPISLTALDAFAGCPMKWISRYVLHLEPVMYEVALVDDRQIGLIFHRIYEQFFRYVVQTTGTFRSDLLASYQEHLQQIATSEFDRYAHSSQAPCETTMQYLRSHYIPKIISIVAAESKWFADYRSTQFEVALQHRYDDQQYRLEGRIDRILERIDDDGTRYCVVVDYKKSFAPIKKEFTPDSELLPSYQLPLYAKLIRDAHQQQVTAAAYFSVAKEKYYLIWDEQSLELSTQLMQRTDKQIEKMIESLQQGIYGVTTSGKPCVHCDYRQICRRRYSLV